MSTRPNKERTYLDLGSYNVTCDRCGKKIKNTSARKEWTGLIVCGRCLDERHPQDFVRARVDHMTVPVARPLPVFTFLTTPNTGITGRLLTPLPSGPENVWDNGNIVNVSVTGGALASVTELQLLGGANLIAIQGTNGWEVLQFQNATLVSGTTYNLTKLLRARYGTYQNMGAPTGALFVYLGQASPSVSAWIQTELGLNVLSQLNISTPIPLYQQSIITTVGAGAIVVPLGFTRMKAEAIGGGGSGSSNNSFISSGGGGGGAYAVTNSITVNPGSVVYTYVGAGGASPASPLSGNNGYDSWVNIANGSSPIDKTQGCLAKAGVGAVFLTGGLGGAAASCIGDTVYSGGNGGRGGAHGASYYGGGGGGGGSAGPVGAGKNGGGDGSGSYAGGSGGGGANDGASTAGATPVAMVGGSGGLGGLGTGAGVGGLSNSVGTAGTAGGGGGGAGGATNPNNGFPGGPGGMDTAFDSTHGAGGGGGGGGGADLTVVPTGGYGGNGGGYGGGGGGGGYGSTTNGLGGRGAQGIIVITFYP
jgi:hypothetical protein